MNSGRRPHKDSQFTNDLPVNSVKIIDAFLRHPGTRDKAVNHLSNVVANTYLHELHSLASENSGRRFGASNATTKQLETFNLGKCH